MKMSFKTNSDEWNDNVTGKIKKIYENKFLELERESNIKSNSKIQLTSFEIDNSIILYSRRVDHLYEFATGFLKNFKEKKKRKFIKKKEKEVEFIKNRDLFLRIFNINWKKEIRSFSYFLILKKDMFFFYSKIIIQSDKCPINFLENSKLTNFQKNTRIAKKFYISKTFTSYIYMNIQLIQKKVSERRKRVQVKYRGFSLLNTIWICNEAFENEKENKMYKFPEVFLHFFRNKKYTNTKSMMKNTIGQLKGFEILQKGFYNFPSPYLKKNYKNINNDCYNLSYIKSSFLQKKTTFIINSFRKKFFVRFKPIKKLDETFFYKKNQIKREIRLNNFDWFLVKKELNFIFFGNTKHLKKELVIPIHKNMQHITGISVKKSNKLFSYPSIIFNTIDRLNHLNKLMENFFFEYERSFSNNCSNRNLYRVFSIEKYSVNMCKYMIFQWKKLSTNEDYKRKNLHKTKNIFFNLFLTILNTAAYKDAVLINCCQTKDIYIFSHEGA
nr:hypothetical protein 1634Bnrm1_p076 [Cryptomonas sp.]